MATRRRLAKTCLMWLQAAHMGRKGCALDADWNVVLEVDTTQHARLRLWGVHDQQCVCPYFAARDCAGD